MTCTTLRLSGKAGFTLVEMVMVLVIIGLLASIVVPQFSLQMNEAREAQTRANLENLRSAVAIYVKKEGYNPGDLASLTLTTPPIVTTVPDDGWGFPFDYVQSTGDVLCDNGNSPDCDPLW